MEYIDFGYGYRLHRRDSANWELQEFRKPSNKGFAKNMEDRSPKWYNMRRRVAVRHHVRELPILRDGD